ncbi:hypothetical protein [Granulosicoccus antarcticus]|uniref:Uncharacterized protein n=1 Tax=Granulosicoccus antarcticus IMCC3135 TaxID=1192854 RepID=A0A2Z2NSF2_9GAMM|nr:hypothetical protein [Granulosicoccus antarcticus]ASJ73435.1 hypothetical protein IMCC3135_16765 [Granulosicoccus antarcticus IMCC3135]
MEMGWSEEAGRSDSSEQSEPVDNKRLFDDHAAEATTGSALLINKPGAVPYARSMLA